MAQFFTITMNLLIYMGLYIEKVLDFSFHKCCLIQ